MNNQQKGQAVGTGVGTGVGAGIGLMFGAPQVGAAIGGPIGGLVGGFFDDEPKPVIPQYASSGSLGYKFGGFREFKGASHESGGHKVGSDEVEGGETEVIINGKPYVFSKRLMVPGMNKSFAQVSKQHKGNKRQLFKLAIKQEISSGRSDVKKNIYAFEGTRGRSNEGVQTADSVPIHLRNKWLVAPLPKGQMDQQDQISQRFIPPPINYGPQSNKLQNSLIGLNTRGYDKATSAYNNAQIPSQNVRAIPNNNQPWLTPLPQGQTNPQDRISEQFIPQLRNQPSNNQSTFVGAGNYNGETGTGGTFPLVLDANGIDSLGINTDDDPDRLANSKLYRKHFGDPETENKSRTFSLDNNQPTATYTPQHSGETFTQRDSYPKSRTFTKRVSYFDQFDPNARVSVTSNTVPMSRTVKIGDGKTTVNTKGTPNPQKPNIPAQQNKVRIPKENKVGIPKVGTDAGLFGDTEAGKKALATDYSKGLNSNQQSQGESFISAMAPYTGDIINMARGLFEKDSTPKPQVASRAPLRDMPTEYNVNPQLNANNRNYRSSMEGFANNPIAMLAAFSQKLNADSSVYGNKQNVENQMKARKAEFADHINQRNEGYQREYKARKSMVRDARSNMLAQGSAGLARTYRNVNNEKTMLNLMSQMISDPTVKQNWMEIMKQNGMI